LNASEEPKSAEPTRPYATHVRIEPAGRLVAPFAVVALIVGWAMGGVALMLSALVTAVIGVALWCALRHGSGVELRAIGRQRQFVGDAFLFELELHARARRPRAQRDLWLSLLDRAALAGRSTQAGRPVAECVRLPGSGALTVRCGHRLLRRGPLNELQLALHSSYPFGLLRVERRYALPVDFLAWPRIGRWRPRRRRARAPLSRPLELALERTEEDEFYQLREWREGLSLRNAHWKLSARRGRTILRDLRGPTDEPMRVGLLLARVPSSLPGRSGRLSFETAVSLCATLLDTYLRRGAAVRLELHGGSGVEVLHLRGRAGRMAALDKLALVEAEDVTEGELLGRAARALEPTIGPLVLAGGGRRALAEAAPGAAERVIDVDAPDLDALFLRVQGPQQRELAEVGA